MAVEFDDSQDGVVVPVTLSDKEPGLTGVLMRAGVVSNKRQAEVVLLILAGIIFVAASLVFFTRVGARSYAPSTEEKAQVEKKLHDFNVEHGLPDDSSQAYR